MEEVGEVNDPEEIEASYYSGAWFANDGPGQSMHFASLIATYLPDELLIAISESTMELADFGSATGDGTFVLHNTFNRTGRTTGVEISDVARTLASHRYPYPYMKFIKNLTRKYDTIVTSNTLEHFENPWPIMAAHMDMAKSFYVILVPWEEDDRIPGHLHTFTILDFPDAVDHEEGTWVRAMRKVIPPDDKYWGKEQVLVVYRREIEG